MLATGVAPSGKKFSVIITHTSKTIYLGTFEDYFEACCVRKKAENLKKSYKWTLYCQTFIDYLVRELKC